MIHIGRVILTKLRRHLRFIVFAILLWSGYTLITFSSSEVKYFVNNNHDVPEKESMKHILINAREYSKNHIKYEDLHFAPQQSFCAKPLQNVHNIHCIRIITRDEDYIRNLSQLEKGRVPRSCDLRTFAHNCSHFVSAHGYSNNPVTLEELNFPLAFGLKVHEHPQQVEQILRSIYRPHNVYCIHVDVGANDNVFHTLKEVAKCFDNVFVIRKYRVIYSSINQPLADKDCMETVMDTRVDWKYYLILSGEEFVLKSNLEIVKILKILNGTNDITKKDDIEGVKERYKYSHHIVDDEVVKTDILKKPFYRNITLYKGSAYGMFSRGFVRYILESSLSKELFRWANDTYAPEEIIWSTLNTQQEAPGGHNVSISHGNGNFLSRALIWDWEETTCHGFFRHRCCVFGFEDLPWLVSVPGVIANKFHSARDQLVLDCLEEWISNKTITQTVDLDWTYYRNLPHVKNPRGTV